LIEDGYIVTNAHVVWPFQETRVVFPDGSEHLNAPVLNWDLLGDLAVIGPLETSISPVELVDGEDLIIGSDTFLIGYPGEVERFPQPTFTRGLISRLREWEPIEMTYFQTDALIAGGQSGGVLVSKEGEVIGISGLWFTEAGFGLVASAADVLPRIQRLIAGEDIAGLGDRRLPLAEGQFEYDFTLLNDWDSSIYVLNEPAETTVDIKLEGEKEGDFALIDAFGNVLTSTLDTGNQAKTGSVTTKLESPYFVFVGQASQDPGDFHVSSNRKLVPYEDRDDGVTVTVGQTLHASLDYPFDFDYFVIKLAADEIIHITVDAILSDPFLSVGYPGANDETQLILDDNSGGGLLGTNAELTYRAPHEGSYFIGIEDTTGRSVGGYFLTVALPPPDATPVSPPPTPTPTATPLPSPTSTPIPTPAIPMALYKSAQYPFAIQYPAQWTGDPELQKAINVTALFINMEQSGSFIILEENLEAIGIGKVTLTEYVDETLTYMASNISGFQLVSRTQIVTPQGFPAEVLVFAGEDRSNTQASRFIYLYEDKIGFNATYLTPKDQYETTKPIIDYSFSTFQIND
jgi:hypothetical protein